MMEGKVGFSELNKSSIYMHKMWGKSIVRGRSWIINSLNVQR